MRVHPPQKTAQFKISVLDRALTVLRAATDYLKGHSLDSVRGPKADPDPWEDLRIRSI